MNYCPNCGEKLQNGKSFCPNCGERIETSQHYGNDFEKPIYDMTDYYFSKEKYQRGSSRKNNVCPLHQLSYEERNVSRTAFLLSIIASAVSLAATFVIIILISVSGDASFSNLYLVMIAPGVGVMLLISLLVSRNYKNDGGRKNGTMRVAFIFRIIGTAFSSVMFAAFLYTSILYTINPYAAYEFWMG